MFENETKTSPKGFSASKCDVGNWIFSKSWNFLRKCLDIFWNLWGIFFIFLFFWKLFGNFWNFIFLIFFSKFLGNFSEGFFWEDFLGGFFWEDFFGRIFWEDFFGRNSLGGIT